MEPHGSHVDHVDHASGEMETTVRRAAWTNGAHQVLRNNEERTLKRSNITVKRRNNGLTYELESLGPMLLFAYLLAVDGQGCEDMTPDLRPWRMTAISHNDTLYRFFDRFFSSSLFRPLQSLSFMHGS